MSEVLFNRIGLIFSYMKMDATHTFNICAAAGHILINGVLAQSEECVVSNDEAPGSKPGFSNIFFFVFYS